MKFALLPVTLLTSFIVCDPYRVFQVRLKVLTFERRETGQAVCRP